MKHLLLLLIVFFTLSLSAQGYLVEKAVLDWQPKQLIHKTNNKIWYMPVVANNSVDLATMTPSYLKKWEVANHQKVVSFETKNIVYENIPVASLFDVALDNIPSKPRSSLQIVTTRDKSHAYYQISPIIKNNAQFKRIKSFEIHYKLTPTNPKRTRTTPNSVLASGEWFKFSIDTTGVYKLDRSFLNSLGLNMSSINPKYLSIYGNGAQLLPYRIGDFRHDDLQENALYISGEDDESFDSGDYVLFYAKGPDNWVHNNTTNSLKHQKNIYTDKAYYFVHVGNQLGKRVQNAVENTQTPQHTFTNYDAHIVHELELVNLFQVGQQWLGESFSVQNEKDIQIEFSNLDTSFPVRIKTRAVASALQSTSLNVSVNSQELYTLNMVSSNSSVLATQDTDTSSQQLSSETLNIHLSYNNNSDPSAECYLDYIEVIGKKHLVVNDKQFSFRNFEAINTSNPVSFSLQNPSNIFQVWDVTNSITPQNITNQGDTSSFSFTTNGGSLKEYIVLNENDFYTPNLLSESKVQNQDLHALSNVDYVIITKDFLVGEAEILAQHHRDHSNLNVKVIPLYQIYNEFGSGGADITAIRDFVKHLYDNSQPQLQYILLYGDASFDFKGIQYDKGIVPAFLSYKSYDFRHSFVTDDYYAIVSDDNEGNLDGFSPQTQDVAIARIPINTRNEASAVTTKILNYYKEVSFGDWRNQVAMIADDVDHNYDEPLQIGQETLADEIKLNKPHFNLKKIWTDAFPQTISAGGSRYPDVNTAISNAVERGALLIDYFGHGGEDGLAHERILEISDINSWSNYDALNLFIVISCEFARFDNPLRPNTAGELVIRNPNGGAASHIATAREILIYNGKNINMRLLPLLLEFNNETRSISDNLRLVKNETFSKQRYFVFSFGDAAMKLAVPKPDIRITHMNGVPVTQSLDTISALSHVYFDGVVTDINGQTDTNFNGEVSLTVFDKPQDKETLVNDGVGSVMVFDTQESKIFRGRASVTNGAFSFDFVAPRDIRIAYGNGKLSFYADNSIKDKGGYNLDVIVGGINEDAPEDNQGPTIRLYMNDESFLDGGTTNQSPLFLAFLEDENGINTSLTSVDHDIVATLDNNQQFPIILNDYYTTELNDFTKGSLEYRLRNLEIGPHIIHLKAYDTYNNPAEATLHFVVLDDNELVLEHVLNYPNPFVNYTEFWFNHNKPNEPLEVQIQVFTVSGKLVKTLNQHIQNTGSLSRDITWDGLDDFGQKIGKGVYIFRVQVKSQLSDLKAEKYEKLVILQ